VSTDDINKSIMLRRLGAAKPGQWLLYHGGFLMDDRLQSRALQSLAKMIYSEYEAGRVTLVQRRLGFRYYEYFAVKL
jgi:hypothetical protein